MTETDLGGDAVFRQIQNRARSEGATSGRPAPTAE